MTNIFYCDSYWKDIERVIKNVSGIEKLYHQSILITGATGLIGSAVTEILLYLNKSDGTDINIYLAGRDQGRMECRFSPFIQGKDYYYVPYDATKMQELQLQVDYIVHGAGYADPHAYSQQPVEVMLCNIVGLVTLLKMAVERRIKRILYISSSEVYGKKQNQEPYDEGDYGYVDILNPRACYPSAKRAAETLCEAYATEYGIDAVIVRPGHIYGPGMTEKDSRAASQFIRTGINGEDIIMKSEGTQRRSYCHSLDCASAILTVLLNGQSGNAYNISNSNSISSIREMAEAVAKSAMVDIYFERATDQEVRSYNLMDNSVLKSEKIEDLGWKGVFELESGISETVNILKGII